jgi:regulator of RNase E activity RraB
MSRKEANTRVLELMEHYGTKDNSVLAVEFFFYADKQDDASNLAIELHKLGYEIYHVTDPGSISSQWSVTGSTLKMSMKEDELSAWTDKMEQLARENNSMFDGWGTLLDPDTE